MLPRNFYTYNTRQAADADLNRPLSGFKKYVVTNTTKKVKVILLNDECNCVYVHLNQRKEIRDCN